MSERWLPIPGYPGYEVSDAGRVRSLDRTVAHSHGRGLRTIAGSVMRPRKDKHGYLELMVSVGARRSLRRVHTLVLLAFAGSPPGLLAAHRGGWQVNHINGDVLDNRPANLEWVTMQQNRDHARVTGLVQRGERHAHHRLTEEQVREVRRLQAAGALSRGAITAHARKLGVCDSTIHAVLTRKSWAWMEG